MSFEINRQSSGLINQHQGQSHNLFDKAVKLSEDGVLSEQDLASLKSAAQLDGNETAEEKLFLNGLANKADRENFVSTAREAQFDPSGFSFGVSGRLNVQVSNKDVNIEFSSNAHAAKRATGDRQAALDSIKKTLPEGLRDAWDKNKYNLAEMKKLFAEMAKGDEKSNPNFRTVTQRMELMQSYLTAYYNHPGVDINWNGASLQEGIHSMPKDAEGRTYIDCEAYSKITEEILGSDHVKHYDVASGAHADGRRDHQMSIITQGDQAYVLSNNEIKQISAKDAGGMLKSPAQMIAETYPDYGNVVADANGPMQFNTNSYAANMVVPFGEAELKVIEVQDNQNHFLAQYTDKNTGNSFHVRTEIDSQTGRLTNRVAPKAGDVLYVDAEQGQRFKMVVGNTPPQGSVTRLDAMGEVIEGSETQARVIADNQGGFTLQPVR